MNHKKKVLFQVSKADNVATALTEIAPGPVSLLGDATQNAAVAAETIHNGHKMAVSAIAAGESVIKYGVVIGRATRDIVKGEWVHLHNMESIVDARGTVLDPLTGVPTDIKYE